MNSILVRIRENLQEEAGLEVSRFPTCAPARVELCCADERERAGAGFGESGPAGGGRRTAGGASGAVLSELLGGTERAALQVELSGVRVLFELLGFLLSRHLLRKILRANSRLLTGRAISVYNGEGI